MSTKLNFRFSVFIFALMLLPGVIRAATFSVQVKAGAEKINAVEGILVLPKDVAVQNIYTGNSAVLVWVTSPSWDAANRTIAFAGITPGGFSGTQPLFTIELAAGDASVVGGRLTGYRNDGEGTAIELEYGIFSAETAEDYEAPEPFAITITSSPAVFGGRTFAVFDSQDKNTGIAKFEYASTWLAAPNDGEWREVRSPQMLDRLELFKKIHVRAIDKAGNIRIVSTAGPYWLISFVFGLILMICLAHSVRRFSSPRS